MKSRVEVRRRTYAWAFENSLVFGERYEVASTDCICLLGTPVKMDNARKVVDYRSAIIEFD